MRFRRTGTRGRALIMHFEGFRAKPYNCPAGHATIGYGLKIHDGPVDGSEPATFRRGICETVGGYLLDSSLIQYEAAVNELIAAELDQHAFDALVSWTYNLGRANLRRSTLRRLINKGDALGAVAQFGRWVKAWDPNQGRKVVLPGLVRRRAAEAALFQGRDWRAAAATLER